MIPDYSAFVITTKHGSKELREMSIEQLDGIIRYIAENPDYKDLYGEAILDVVSAQKRYVLAHTVKKANEKAILLAITNARIKRNDAVRLAMDYMDKSEANRIGMETYMSEIDVQL